jgi:aspartate/methionine/tyrosine aminotransferase
LLGTVERGKEVVMHDPIYAGLINRAHLAEGTPRFVTCRPSPAGWHSDPEELAAAVNERTAAVLMMSPAMPTGAVIGAEHWDALAEALHRHNAWLIYDAAMERIRFDGLPAYNPATHPGLRDRTITIGSASKELRMIGWRVGWVVGPSTIIHDINLVALSNVVCQVGVAQSAVAAALNSSTGEADVVESVRIWGERASHIVEQLADYHPVPAHGGWSVLLNTRAWGFDPAMAADMLFSRGRVAATPMLGWGPSAGDYLRLVFANEPIERLADIRERFDRSFH